MKCPVCGNEIPNGVQYCDNCGHPIDSLQSSSDKIFCGNCGAEIEKGDTFCGECGAPVDTSKPDTEEVMFCGNCGAKMMKGDTVCSNCGYLNDEDNVYPQPVKKKSVLPVVLIVVSILAVACAAVFGGSIIYNKVKNDNIKVEENVTTEVPAEMSTDQPTTSPSVTPSQSPLPTALTTPTTAPYTSSDGRQEKMTTYYVVNCNENISLRDLPSTSAKVLRTIPLGAPVSYVESSQNGFAKVIYNGTTGFALQSYLSLTPPDRSSSYNTGGVDSKRNSPNSRLNNGGSAGVVSNPTYMTYTDRDYNFTCPYPSHFQPYNEQNNFMRYTMRSPDNTATFKICATRNSSNLSVAKVSENFKTSFPGSLDYEASGDDWCITRTYNNGTYHYGYFNLSSGMIRGFEFHFSGSYFDIYDKYINDIYDNMQFD